MTQQFIGSQLRILQSSLASAAEAAANLASILVEPTDAPPQECQHPAKQRVDLTAMGDAPGSYWRCNACGHTHDMRGHHADDSQA